LIFRDDEVVAVLDWEMSHIGPPEADLAFLIFADIALADLYDVERLPGLPDEAATIEHFEQLTGRPIENWAFHTLFQVLKLAVLGELASRALGAMGLGEINVDTSSNWPTRKLEQLLGTAT
jgi:aminoglycoside phosphotransferase (APT) family kinase protein